MRIVAQIAIFFAYYGAPILAAVLGATAVRDYYDLWKPAALPAVSFTAWFLYAMFGMAGYHGDQGGFILIVPLMGLTAS